MTPKLCVITDIAVQNRFSHIELAELAIRGGADMIQLRDKKMKSGELLETAIAMRKLCEKSEVTFIVNDRVDIALLADADGVHLGQDDFPIAEARKILGPQKIIGGSAASLEQALLLEQQRADYIGFGHIFPTATKLKQTLPKGIPQLSEVCKNTKIQIFAIGGIDLSNLPQILNTHLSGIAVVRAVCASENPERSTRELKEALLAHSALSASL